MKIANEIASDLRAGTVFHVTGERIGVRPVKRIWLNRVTAHYVADVGGLFMWSEHPDGPWKAAPVRVSAFTPALCTPTENKKEF